MARTETMVQLTDDLLQRLDRESSRRGCSRSVLIREAISEHLDRHSIEEKERQYIESYTHLPQTDGDRDEWGDLSKSAASATRTAMAALDAEAAARGDEW